MGKSFEEKVGRNLNRILYDKKVSQAELASVAGVSEAAISKMMNGIRVPSAEKMTIIEKYLGVSHEELTR